MDDPRDLTYKEAMILGGDVDITDLSCQDYISSPSNTLADALSCTFILSHYNLT